MDKMTKQDAIDRMTFSYSPLRDEENSRRYIVSISYLDRAASFEYGKGFGLVEERRVEYSGRRLTSNWYPVSGIHRKSVKFVGGETMEFFAPYNDGSIRTTYQYQQFNQVSLADSRPKYRLAPPQLSEVMESLCREVLDYGDLRTFDDFCEAFGYNNDSISDKKIYEEMGDNFSKMRKLFASQLGLMCELFKEEE